MGCFLFRGNEMMFCVFSLSQKIIIAVRDRWTVDWSAFTPDYLYSLNFMIVVNNSTVFIACPEEVLYLKISAQT